MNIKIIAAAATLAMLHPSTEALAFSGASSIPANVTAVYPQPDGRVDLGPNVSPLGLQQISVMFSNDVTVNPACTAEACIYRAGKDTPLQTVGVTGASVDLTQSRMGSVMFPNTCTSNGEYRVTIPEGFWKLDGAGYSGAFDLYYEIFVPQRVWPTDPVAKELKEFRLEFSGYDEARLLDAKKIEFFRHSSADTYSIHASVGKNEDGTPANYILITLQQPATEQGDYSLFVQAGAAEGIMRGENGDIVSTEPNIEALYRYTVSHTDAPSIAPEQGEIANFSTFELTVPEGFDFWFVNDKAISFIYPTYEDGTLAPDAAYRLTGTRDGETDRIVLKITGDGASGAEVTPLPGNYALKLASGLYSGSWNGEFINSAPFVYYYQVPGNGSGAALTSSDPTAPILKGIYTIDGKKITEGTDGEGTGLLPEGVYIIDGQKKYIRNGK